MKEVRVRIITHSSELPPMNDNNYFHSNEFFMALEKTPGMKPCMAIAITQDQQVVGRMLAVIVTRRWFLPPISLRYGHVYGEGCYAPNADTSRIFGLLLMAVTNKFKHELCLFAEFSNISKKMFGYRQFRKQGYVPIPWQEIHNSLHSMPPEDRLSERQLQQIKEISDHGVEVRPCANDEERHLYISLLRKHFMLKSRRYIPDERLFVEMERSGHAVHLVTVYKGHVIGGCTLVFSSDNACLWFLAARRKTFMFLRPAFFTVWGALRYAHGAGYAHLRFFDVGLPLRKNSYREFILSFGGKPTAKYRWFQLPVPWINNIMKWSYGV